MQSRLWRAAHTLTQERRQKKKQRHPPRRCQRGCPLQHVPSNQQRGTSAVTFAWRTVGDTSASSPGRLINKILRPCRGRIQKQTMMAKHDTLLTPQSATLPRHRSFIVQHGIQPARRSATGLGWNKKAAVNSAACVACWGTS